MTDLSEIRDTAQYNRQEAAYKLGISISTLDNYRRAGDITCRWRKKNNRPFYYGRDLKKFLKSELEVKRQD